MLGEAVHSFNVSIMVISLTFWELIRHVARYFLENKKFSSEITQELSIACSGTVHAVLVCSFSAFVIAIETKPECLYSKIELSQVIFAISSGYFIWDLMIVLFITRFDLAFFLHAFACLLCYVFGQYPFLNYWGLYFLMFELSTPFLHMRRAMILTKNTNSKWFPIVENTFGLTFIFVRLLVGIPLSVLVWVDLIYLLEQPQKIHSYLVVYFYLIANFGLCLLNLIWFWQMTRKKTRLSKIE